MLRGGEALHGRKGKLTDINLRDLKHTCATLLLTKGVHPKIHSEMLRHSSVAITLDIYSPVTPGLGDAMALAMEDAPGDDRPGVDRSSGEAATLRSGPLLEGLDYILPGI